MSDMDGMDGGDVTVPKESRRAQAIDAWNLGSA